MAGLIFEGLDGLGRPSISERLDPGVDFVAGTAVARLDLSKETSTASDVVRVSFIL